MEFTNGERISAPWHGPCDIRRLEVIPCVLNFHLVGERILGERKFPENPDQKTKVRPKKADVTDYFPCIAAGFAE
jgi:hypothetical protein